jgi:hypothetical protein
LQVTSNLTYLQLRPRAHRADRKQRPTNPSGLQPNPTSLSPNLHLASRSLPSWTTDRLGLRPQTKTRPGRGPRSWSRPTSLPALLLARLLPRPARGTTEPLGTDSSGVIKSSVLPGLHPAHGFSRQLHAAHHNPASSVRPVQPTTLVALGLPAPALPLCAAHCHHPFHSNLVCHRRRSLPSGPATVAQHGYG